MTAPFYNWQQPFTGSAATTKAPDTLLPSAEKQPSNTPTPFTNPMFSLPSRLSKAPTLHTTPKDTFNTQVTNKTTEASDALTKALSESEYLEAQQKKMEERFADMGVPPTDKLLWGAGLGFVPSYLLARAFGLKDQFTALTAAKAEAPIYKFAKWIDSRWGIRKVSGWFQKLGDSLIDHPGAPENSSRFRKLLSSFFNPLMEKASPEIDNFFTNAKPVDVVKNHVENAMKSIEHVKPRTRYQNHTQLKELLPKKMLLSEKAEHFINAIYARETSNSSNKLSERIGNIMNRYADHRKNTPNGARGDSRIIRQFISDEKLKALLPTDKATDLSKVTIKDLKRALKPGLFTKMGNLFKSGQHGLTTAQRKTAKAIIKLAKREKKYLYHLAGTAARLDGFNSMHMHTYHIERGLMKNLKAKNVGPVGRFIVSFANVVREVLDGSFITGHSGGAAAAKGFWGRLGGSGKYIMPLLIPAMAIGMPLYEAGKAKYGDRLATGMHHLMGYEFGMFIGWQIGRNFLNEINWNTHLTRAIDFIPKTIEKGIKAITKKSPYLRRVSHWMSHSIKLPLMGRISNGGFLMFMIFSQTFANRFKRRFEKISHFIFGYPESVRATEAKEKAEELANEMSNLPQAFQNTTEAGSLSQRKTNGLNTPSAADTTQQPSLPFSHQAHHLLNFYKKRTANTVNQQTPIAASSLSQSRSIHSNKPTGSNSRPNANNFFKRTRRTPSTLKQPPVAKTVPPITTASIAPTVKSNVDPFSSYDPTRIPVVPPSLPEQLQREAHQLADVYNESVAL